MNPVEDSLGLGMPGVYCITCLCSKSYLGEMGRTIEVQCKEHQQKKFGWVREKSVLAALGWERERLF